MAIATDAKLGLSNRFHLKIVDGDKDLGSWKKAEGLDVKWDLCEYRAGDAGNERWYFPGKSEYTNIRLSRAACSDSEKVKEWLGKTSWEHAVGTLATLTLHDSAGKEVITWELRDVMPVHWTIAGFDAGTSSVAIETLEIAHMGFLEDLKALG